MGEGEMNKWEWRLVLAARVGIIWILVAPAFWAFSWTEWLLVEHPSRLIFAIILAAIPMAAIRTRLDQMWVERNMAHCDEDHRRDIVLRIDKQRRQFWLDLVNNLDRFLRGFAAYTVLWFFLFLLWYNGIREDPDDYLAFIRNGDSQKIKIVRAILAEHKAHPPKRETD